VIVWCHQSKPIVVHHFDTALLVMDYQSHPEHWGEIDNFGGTKKLKGAIWEKNNFIWFDAQDNHC